MNCVGFQIPYSPNQSLTATLPTSRLVSGTKIAISSTVIPFAIKLSSVVIPPSSITTCKSFARRFSSSHDSMKCFLFLLLDLIS